MTDRCDICGKLFIKKAENAKYCGERCRKIAKSRQDAAYQKTAKIKPPAAAKPKPAKPDPHKEIKAIVNAALAEGISYGMYVHKYGL